MKLESGLFAEVPHELVTARRLKPSVKVILIHCLVRYQTKKDSGEPWTFSEAGIAAETGLSPKTVGRHVGPLRKKGVLKLYGTMSDGEREYEVFTFSPEGLVALLRTTAKTSVVLLRAANGDGAAILETARDKLADNLSDNLSDRMPPRREDGRKEEDRREEKSEKDLVASSPGPSPAAAGSFPVGIPSTPVAPPAFDATTIQNACGGSDAGGQNKPDTFVARVSAPIIQPSAGGDANIGAGNNTAGLPKKSAPRAAGTNGIGLTDAELDAIVEKTGCTRDQLRRMENVAAMEVVYGVNGGRPRHGFDSL
jgi:hypothetical protein